MGEKYYDVTKITKTVLEKISLRILEQIDALNETGDRGINDYTEGFINGLSLALQIVNGGKQND